MAKTLTQKGLDCHAKKRKNFKIGRQQGIQDSQQSEIHANAKKRCGKRLDSGTRQEEEVIDPKLVLVEWVDSFGCSPNWQRIDGIENLRPMRCQSVGWLVHQDDHYFVVVPHLSASDQPHIDQQGCGDMAIPQQSVLTIQSLQPEKQK